MIECPPIPDPNEKPCNAITTSAYSIQGLFFFESFIRYYPIAFALSIMMLPSTSIVTHSLKRPKWINYTKSNALRISYHIKRKRKDFTIIYMCPCNWLGTLQVTLLCGGREREVIIQSLMVSYYDTKKVLIFAYRSIIPCKINIR